MSIRVLEVRGRRFSSVQMAALGAVILAALVAQIAVAGDHPAPGTITLSKAELNRLIDQRIEDRLATTSKKKKKVKRGPAGPQGPPGTPADASALKVHCAANTIAIGSSLCLDSTPVSTVSYSSALTTCASRGERLPSISELNLAYAKGLLEGARFWSDTTYYSGGVTGTPNSAVDFNAGTGGIEAYDKTLTASFSVVCASSPTNA